jgi:hypothetical protein
MCYIIVMTTLLRPLRRETSDIYRGRPLVVTAHPRHVELHEKGRRDVLSVDYATIYELALRLRWRKRQAEKKAEKKRKV